MLKIAKSAKNKRSWFVIDSTWGINIKFAAKTQKECVKWCKVNKFNYSKGWIW